MDETKFFSALRGSALYPSGIPQSAVQALDAMLAASAGLSNAELAYCMATAYHEVGRNLLPIRESLNYTATALLNIFSRARISAADANRLGRKKGEGAVPAHRQQEIANLIYGGEWGRKNLGNTLAGDGWRFRGGGYPQTTGRANYRKIGGAVGADLEAYPDRIMEQEIAIHALIEAMKKGVYTGKSLSSYKLPAQFKDARAIINDDVGKNGSAIAGHANKFLTALDAAGRGYGEVPKTAAPAPSPAPSPKPTPVPDLKPDTTTPPMPQVPTPRPPSARPGLIATAVALLGVGAAAAWQWLAAIPCNLFNLFCGG